MSKAPDTLACAECGAQAERACRRCGVPLCEDHAAKPPAGACARCARALGRQVAQGKLVRVAGASGAAVGGLMAGALVTMVLANLIGITPEIIILLMLMAEVACGGMAAYAADRRIKRWLDDRADKALSGLPEARLLTSGLASKDAGAGKPKLPPADSKPSARAATNPAEAQNAGRDE